MEVTIFNETNSPQTVSINWFMQKISILLPPKLCSVSPTRKRGTTRQDRRLRVGLTNRSDFRSTVFVLWNRIHPDLLIQKA